MLHDYPTYRQLLVDCRKPKCRGCKKGPSHGPYWFAEWKGKRGKVSTKYVGKRLPYDVAKFYAEQMNGGRPGSNADKVHRAALVELEAYAGGRRVVTRCYPPLHKGGAWSVELACPHHAGSPLPGRGGPPLRLETTTRPKLRELVVCPRCAAVELDAGRRDRQ